MFPYTEYDMRLGSMRKLLKIINQFLLGITVAAVIYYVFRNTRDIIQYHFNFSWYYIIGGLLVFCISTMGYFIVWEKIINSFGIHPTFLRSGKAWSLSRLGRFVPGYITFAILRLNIYNQYPKRSIALATVIEHITSIIAACYIVLISIIMSANLIPIQIKWGAIISSIFLLIILWPPLLKKITNIFLQLLKKDTVDVLPSYGKILVFIGSYMINCFTSGFAFYLILRALSPVGIENFFNITGAYFAAGLLGLLAPFAPAGIGVFEGVLFLILPVFLPKQIAIIGTILIRIIMVLGEMMIAGIFVIIGRNTAN